MQLCVSIDGEIRRLTSETVDLDVTLMSIIMTVPTDSAQVLGKRLQEGHEVTQVTLTCVLGDGEGGEEEFPEEWRAFLDSIDWSVLGG